MPTKFRRPAPRDQLSRSYSLGEMPLSQDPMSRLSSFSMSDAPHIRYPDSPLGPDEVFVYYDSAWSTDEVCFPPVRQHRGAQYQPNVVARRAATADAGVCMGHDDSPSKSRPLVKAVGKAKGLVKVVARNSIRKLRRKNEAGEMVAVIGASSSAPSLTSSTSDDWSETSGVSKVARNNVAAHAASAFTAVDSESRFSVHSTDCLAPPKFPSKPHNSNMSAGFEPPTPPPIAEQDAYELLNILICGPIMPGDLPADTAEPTSGPAEENDQEEPATDPPSSNESRSPESLLANAARVVLFLPWCVLIGGAILLLPAAAGPLAFHHGFTRAPPPRGLRRFAYWAENAYEHAFVFLAVLAVLLYRDADAQRRACTLGALVVRWAWVWLGYCPPAGLHKRIGEDDMESLWLMWKGRAVVDAITHKEGAGAGTMRASGSCSNECECHGVCLLSCPEAREKIQVAQ
ncbi:hypothetical protein C2E23DRAFT_889896 [Lenzites betulinus]|nr:hypothetical protein C2E23DRAFT_889896 [Lenzites betulinus]